MKKNKSKKARMNRFEKMFFSFTILLALLFPLVSVYSKSVLSKVNYEVEEMKEEAATYTKSNEDLQMQVNELASLENLENVAKKMGLKYTYNNVKVVD